ncbi:MAG: hypothetical protein GY829_14895 [Gammaproteobacteria bacterium]|nr:hypothetical protein [Gammaproteobacteria bacterium]
MNELEQLKKLIVPKQVREKVEVTNYDAPTKTATVQTSEGNSFTIPSDTVSIGDNLYIKDGVVTGSANALPLSTISI